MKCENAEDILNKLNAAVREFGRKLLLLSPIGRRDSIYEDADYLAFSALSAPLEGKWDVSSARVRTTGHLIKLLKREPSVVGITSTSPDHPNAILTARKVVEATGGKVLVLKGGVHEKHCSRITMENHPEIDVSFAGEADLSLPKFLEGELPGGIAYRDRGSVISSRQVLSEEEFRNTPLPLPSPSKTAVRWDLFGGKRVARVMTQRGCDYACRFCASSGKMRKHGISRIVDYLREASRAGFESVFYEDSTFTLEREHTLQLLGEIIKSGIVLPSGAQTRFDCLDEERVDMLRMAGFSYIYAGTESYDRGVLERINKKLTPEEITSTILMLKKAGIRVGVPIARGFPGDSEEIFEDTLHKLVELEPDFIFLECAKIYPGTGWSRDFGEEEVQRAYDKGIRETQALENPEDRGTLPFHRPGNESVQKKVREFKKAYKTAKRVLSRRYAVKSIGCYKLKG